MKKWQIALTCLAVLTAIVSGSLVLAENPAQQGQTLGDGQTLVRVYYADREMANKIFISFEAAMVETNYEQGYHLMAVTQEEMDRLQAAGLDVVVAEKQEYPIIGSIPSYPCYRTVEETFASAQSIVNNHPTLATWNDVGNSWEKTAGIGGYDMMVLKLTNSAIPGPKPKLFINGDIHAREYTTAEMATRFGEYLIDNYGTDADATWILDYTEVHLMLHTNPDGRKKAETGLSWRKNTNQNYCGATSNSRGADLNRNFSYQWGCCGGSSGYECDATYRGPYAASEPETQAVQNYMLAIFPDQRGTGETTPAPLDATGVYIDLHSYSELVLWPWGYTSTQTGNATQLQTLGRKFAYWNSYTPQQSIGLYPTDGTTDDYLYGELGVASYCFEMGTSFFQSCSYFEGTIVPEIMPALIYAAKVSRTPYMTPAGPDALDLALSNSSVPAGTLVTLSGTVNDTRYYNGNGTEPTQNIAAAEYYVDTPPWGTGATAIAMSASDGSFNAKVEGVQATVDTTGWSQGKHTLFVRGKDANNNWGAVSAIFLTITSGTPEPTPTHTPTPEPGADLFVDDFETNKGWTVNPSGTDTATTGMWERANPEGVDYSGAKQLDITHSGSYDLVTGPLAGSSAGAYDIDGGVTSIRSPNIGLPTGLDITLSFYYYLAHYSNSGSDDFLRVKVVGSTTQTVFQELGAADNDNAVWDYFSTSLNSFAGQTVYLLIEAADAGSGSLVEAAVDDVLVTTSGGPLPTPTPTVPGPTSTPTPTQPVPTSTPTPPPPTPTPTSSGGW